MIHQVVHEKADTTDACRPEGVALALVVAEDLHRPFADAPRTVAVPELMGLRTPAVRPRRAKVPLHRLTAIAA
ncbi:hypothetical protein [Streptomyces thermodiastaticus]|jgi:hypothetical protein|uniref:hypothetical protein n=1 Tax=Streptomyces thermodiastaticus TaxID=44061 RepID=UPI00167651D3|nr:hypothetical protein [Streptomyces thermodiastaticus]MCE7550609.1 hypothetical protein [Streptomyces thermodiastaticus]GHF70540.1 hypothetical protein GCM10018787_18690 [Streptomyces thermodiastaticus]